MIVTFNHTIYMTMRHLRSLARQPWYIAFSLMQPIIYLLLFGALFQKVAELPGFGAGSYITFLTPGVVIMSALFGAGWTGMAIVNDLDRGVLDRFLVTPASRVALIAGRLVQVAVVTVIQSSIIVGLGLIVGARFAGGPLGVIALIVCAVLLGAPFAALSIGMSLLARKEESVIGAVNFVLLPLTFLSSVFMARSLMPAWMQTIARFNPVNWAVDAARSALASDADWGLVLTRIGLLLVLAIVCTWLSMRAFRTYQRSV
ncbi:MAG: ABC transporter permease [Chloroflexi bacterium]|nr:ABC transporter permease [Chloroflexota bacterium]